MSGRSSATRRKHQRRRGTRTEKRTFLIYCEGERTEIDYLEALQEVPEIRDGASVEIRIDYGTAGSVPMKLVEAAVDGPGIENEDDEIDEVWCVFDVEWPKNHPKLNASLQLAHSHGVRTAVSNPCFEYWLVLHFEQPLDWLTSKDAEILRQQFDQSKGKEVDGTTYMHRRAKAVRQARYVKGWHERAEHEFPMDNPSSDMYVLLVAMEG